MAVGDHSASTRQEFRSRHCQGGGVTWAALLGVLANRRGTTEPLEAPAAGWTGEVSTLRTHGQTVTFSIDEEGDAARLCADSQAFLDELMRDTHRLNADVSELRRAMAEADPLALECLLSDGGVPPLPEPVESDGLARARALMRAEAQAAAGRGLRALRAQQTWCWPPKEAWGYRGVLHFDLDGGATESVAGAARAGRWRFDDYGRLEVTLATGGPRPPYLLDADADGRLGVRSSIGFEALLSGPACAGAPP